MEQKVRNISGLRPTQMTVGMKEVEHKQHELIGMIYPGVHGGFNSLKYDSHIPEHLLRTDAFLKAHPVPIATHGKDAYLLDHHHLCLAAYRIGIPSMYVAAEVVLSAAHEAWDQLEHMGLVHPLDETGTRHVASRMPGSVLGLLDDPYRSLAWMARKADAFDKTNGYFSEFEWADYLRRSIPIEAVYKNFDEAAKVAIALCQNHKAKHLPGYKKR